MAQFRITLLQISQLFATSLLLGACSDWEKPPVASQANAEQTPEQKKAALWTLAETGDAGAQYILGLMYYDGDGVLKDFIKAANWFQKAAAQGDSASQLKLGGMYYQGMGVPKDYTKAVEWFQKAATQGDAKGQLAFGLIYRVGAGLSKDATKAAEWFQKSATQGNVEAQVILGMAYLDGEGVPKDATKAAEWFQKAAMQGDAGAQFKLGLMYYDGNGVPKDATKAAEWYQKAALQGDAGAQFLLGLLYCQGEGASKDRVLGYAWINFAAGTGLEDAVKLRTFLEQELPPTSVAEAQRISSSWEKGAQLAREGKSITQKISSSGTPGALSKQGTGTAFLVAKTGQAITNHHVTDGCKEVRVQGGDGVAKLITSDKVNDLALIQVTGTINATAPINAEPSKLRQGEDVVVYGFPLNSLLSSGGNFTPGVVSAMTGLGNNTNQIQITAPIQPGSSGSAVLNKKGEVVGVVSMKLSDAMMVKATGQVGQNVNFAVSGQTLKTFLDTHQVPFTSGSGFFSREKSTTDLAEEARKWTLLVECWK